MPTILLPHVVFCAHFTRNAVGPGLKGLPETLLSRKGGVLHEVKASAIRSIPSTSVILNPQEISQT